MNDFQSLLIFVTAVIGITAIMLVILQNNFLSTIEKTKNTNKRKLEIKKSSRDMQIDGLNLIKEELIKRDLQQRKAQQRDHHERAFVVYDAVTGETFNYYEKKR